MIEYVNECCECSVPAYPCDPYCRRKRVPHYYCDFCHEETTTYYFNGKELCIGCIEEELEKVEDDEGDD